jgi:hypothetical protein
MKNGEIACVVGRVISVDVPHWYITIDQPERGKTHLAFPTAANPYISGPMRRHPALQNTALSALVLWAVEVNSSDARRAVATTRSRSTGNPREKRAKLRRAGAAPTSSSRSPSQGTNRTVRANAPRLATVPETRFGHSPGSLCVNGGSGSPRRRWARFPFPH